MKHRPLETIAREIRHNWTKMSAYAKPYVSAMSQLNSINDRYILESAREVVIRFLTNASTWRGETAQRIKAELKQMLAEGE